MYDDGIATEKFSDAIVISGQPIDVPRRHRSVYFYRLTIVQSL